MILILAIAFLASTTTFLIFIHKHNSFQISIETESGGVTICMTGRFSLFTSESRLRDRFALLSQELRVVAEATRSGAFHPSEEIARD